MSAFIEKDGLSFLSQVIFSPHPISAVPSVHPLPQDVVYNLDPEVVDVLLAELHRRSAALHRQPGQQHELLKAIKPRQWVGVGGCGKQLALRQVHEMLQGN